ncbi:uncharacterized protein LOC124284100 [Haliotis rubra]|uniref:uncharacterized protein LOC124284100 n=1 Tax=Haliotis rubra TaxID=36100 RepID=UPI001EE56EF2|nr:uncharacterized protein LOC124284100 [Haliotis rubra]
MPDFKKVISGVSLTRAASQSESSHEVQEQIDTLRLWLDKIKVSAITQDKVETNIIERKRLFLLKREIDHSIDLVSKLCLLSGRSTTVQSSLRNVHRIVHKVARQLKVSQHLPPPVYSKGKFIQPGKLRRFLSLVYRRCSRIAAFQTGEESESNNHEKLLAIIRERKTPEKPNRKFLYRHRDILARLKDRRGSRIHTKSLRRVCQMSEVPEEDLIGQGGRSTTDLSETCPSTFSFERRDSIELVLSGQRSSQELLAVKESCSESDSAEEVVFKVETVPDTLSDGNTADEPFGPDPGPVRSPRATLPPLQISPRSTRSSVSGHLGPGSPEADALPALRVSPVLPSLSPRSTGKLINVKTLSTSPTPGSSEADTEPVRSPVRVTSSHDLPADKTECGNDTTKEMISHLEITKANTTEEVSSETSPLRVRSPRRSSLPPLKISPRSTGKPSIPAVNEVETDMTSKLETSIGLGALYALPPIKMSKSSTNDGNDTTSNSVNTDAQSEDGQESAVDGSVAASSSADTASLMSPGHSSVPMLASRMNTPKKSVFVRAWRRLRGMFCIKKVAPL